MIIASTFISNNGHTNIQTFRQTQMPPLYVWYKSKKYGKATYKDKIGETKIQNQRNAAQRMQN